MKTHKRNVFPCHLFHHFLLFYSIYRYIYVSGKCVEMLKAGCEPIPQAFSQATFHHLKIEIVCPKCNTTKEALIREATQELLVTLQISTDLFSTGGKEKESYCKKQQQQQKKNKILKSYIAFWRHPKYVNECPLIRQNPILTFRSDSKVQYYLQRKTNIAHCNEPIEKHGSGSIMVWGLVRGSEKYTPSVSVNLAEAALVAPNSLSL